MEGIMDKNHVAGRHAEEVILAVSLELYAT
jgi:hypothetical protein